MCFSQGIKYGGNGNWIGKDWIWIGHFLFFLFLVYILFLDTKKCSVTKKIALWSSLDLSRNK